MILVVGGTGTVGSEVLRGLRRAGEDVRALVRSADRAAAVEAEGAIPVIGDLAAPETLPAALAGADRAFIVLPASPDQVERETAFARAAAAAGDVRVVKLSVLGADAASPVYFCAQHGRAEAAYRDAGVELTPLRPNDFMQNALRWAPTICREDRASTFGVNTRSSRQ